MSRAIVVLSGGQDSTTCLYWALERFKNVHCITFDYGQKHRIEIDAARQIVSMANVRYPVTHEVIKVPNCLISMSPLTNDKVELERYNNAQEMEQIIGNRRELTFVPMRNALFLTIAANRAEAMGVKNVITGVCQMDNANYDDCRQIFIDLTEQYINTALGHDHRNVSKDYWGPGLNNRHGWIRIFTPLMNLSKAETVLLAKDLPGCWDALAYSHTSYDGCYPPTDNNHANVLRADGFEKAGLPDPLVLRAWREGLMPLPATANYDEYRSAHPGGYR